MPTAQPGHTDDWLTSPVLPLPVLDEYADALLLLRLSLTASSLQQLEPVLPTLLHLAAVQLLSTLPLCASAQV